MDELKKQQLLGNARLLLGVLMGWIAGKGWLSGEDMKFVNTLIDTVLPIAATLGLMWWSTREKRRTEEKAVVREIVAANAGAAGAKGVAPEYAQQPTIPVNDVPPLIEAFKESRAAEVIKSDAVKLAQGKAK